MKKSWIMILLALLLLMPLTACRSATLPDESTPETPTISQPTSEPTLEPSEPTTESTDPDATQPSVSEEVVVFVKEDEPTKLYCAPKNDLSQQRVIYESDFDAINDFVIEELGVYADKILTLTEGNKRVVMLDLTTGEATAVFECYYIEYAELVGLQEVDGKPYFTRVLFDGKPTENDRNSTYFFWTDSKTITEMPMQKPK